MNVYSYRLYQTKTKVMTCGAGEFGRLGLGGSSDVHDFTLIDWIEDENVGRCQGVVVVGVVVGL
jgi:hypothetical protein